MNLLNNRHGHFSGARSFLCSLGMSGDSIAHERGRQMLAILEELTEDAARRIVDARCDALERRLSEISAALAQLNGSSASTVVPDPVRLVKPRWLTIAEAAAVLGFHPKYVGTLCRSGAIRAVQPFPRGHWRIHADDVDAFRRGETTTGGRRGPRKMPRSQHGR